MERSRLAVLFSHIRPFDSGRPTDVSPAPASNIASSHEISDKEAEERDCVFCMITRGESPAFKIYEDDLCVCILDSHPLCYGHSLVIPKSHYSSFGVTPPSVVAGMCSKVPFLSKAIMKATLCDSFNLLVNNGAAAGQVIFHTHLHIIPRNSCDRLWTHKSFGRKPLQSNQDAARLTECIREGLLLQSSKLEDFEILDSNLAKSS